MELESKIKTLQEEFKDFPKVLIKTVLLRDDVNEDLAKAMDGLQELKAVFIASPSRDAVRRDRKAKSWIEGKVQPENYLRIAL